MRTPQSGLDERSDTLVDKLWLIVTNQRTRIWYRHDLNVRFSCKGIPRVEEEHLEEAVRGVGEERVVEAWPQRKERHTDSIENCRVVQGHELHQVADLYR
jgi:hypothetical protein